MIELSPMAKHSADYRSIPQGSTHFYLRHGGCRTCQPLVTATCLLRSGHGSSGASDFRTTWHVLQAPWFWVGGQLQALRDMFDSWWFMLQQAELQDVPQNGQIASDSSSCRRKFKAKMLYLLPQEMRQIVSPSNWFMFYISASISCSYSMIVLLFVN